MKPAGWKELLFAAVLAIIAAFLPMVANGYWLSIGVTAMMYIALATSWVLFSGPTHYISLAMGAFFGVGGYLVGSGMSDYEQSFWTMTAIAPIVGAVLAALIGLATLRLSGVYFVIFTLGLAEMIRNVVSWVQNNFLGSRGLYVLTDFRDLFGDESADYQMALDGYYENGPAANWRQQYISAYASAHPAEDWAESWGHYLHIHDALETAAAHGLTERWPENMDITERISTWRDLSITLNELNRSVGKRDAYPFLLNEAVAAKLGFVERFMELLREL